MTPEQTRWIQTRSQRVADDTLTEWLKTDAELRPLLEKALAKVMRETLYSMQLVAALDDGEDDATVSETD